MKYEELVINADHVGQYVLATHFIMKCTQCCMTLPRLCTHSEHTEMTRDVLELIVQLHIQDYNKHLKEGLHNTLFTLHLQLY